MTGKEREVAPGVRFDVEEQVLTFDFKDIPEGAVYTVANRNGQAVCEAGDRSTAWCAMKTIRVKVPEEVEK